MTSVLLIGDTHCTQESLSECESLYNLIYESTVKYKPDFVLFLGDDIDGHAYPAASVQHFVVEQTQRLEKLCPVIFILGNHSFSPNHPEKHSLLSLKFLKNTTVIDSPVSLFGFDFMPFRKNNEQFIRESKSLPGNLLFCHVALRGAQYENGWTEDGGPEPKELKHSKIISGHIHAEGTIGQCWYPGSPRWMKRSDANSDKNLYLYDTDNDTYLKIPTWPAVQKMVSLELTDKDVIPSMDDINTKYFVTLKGNLQFCQQTAELIGDKAEVKTILVKQRKNQLERKSTVELSLKEYLENNYKIQSDIDKDILVSEINKRMI